MQVTAARKAIGITLGAIMVLSLATSSAFAGKGQGAFNGNKSGTWHKDETYLCADGYGLVYDSYSGADLNENDYVCEKYAGNEGGYTQVDDITKTTKWD
jgi:hypothetical protein